MQSIVNHEVKVFSYLKVQLIKCLLLGLIYVKGLNSFLVEEDSLIDISPNN